MPTGSTQAVDPPTVQLTATVTLVWKRTHQQRTHAARPVPRRYRPQGRESLDFGERRSDPAWLGPTLMLLLGVLLGTSSSRQPEAPRVAAGRTYLPDDLRNCQRPRIRMTDRPWLIKAGRTNKPRTQWRHADRIQEPTLSTRGVAMVFGSLGASGLPTHHRDLGHQFRPSGTHLRRNWTASGRHGARDQLQRRGGSALAAGAVCPLGNHSGRFAGLARTQRSASASPGPAGLVRPSTR